MLPRLAVDEWGFVSEDRDPFTVGRGLFAAEFAGLQRFRSWRKAFGEFTSAVNSIVRPIVEETAVFVY